MTGIAPSIVPAAVLAKAIQIPNSIAIVDGDQRISYAQLSQQIGDAAKAMLAAGIEHGDRVAIWAPNSAEWIIATLGAQSVGAAVVPINTRYKSAEAAHPLSSTGAKLLIAANGFMGIDAEAAVAIAASANGTSPRIVDLNAPDDADNSWSSFLAVGQTLSESDWRTALAKVDPDDICDIMFTSGSTGKPKGVPHRHGVTVRQTLNTVLQNGNISTDRYLVVNPFFHVFGYTGGWMPALLVGATVYPLAVFDVDQVLHLIETEKITYFPGPPTIFHSILEHPQLSKFDVTSLRATLTGAADVPVELIQRMLDELTFDRVIQAYGMTECGTVTYTLPDDTAATVAASIGVACHDCELRIVDEDNNPVAPNEPGEIVVRGYSVMDGYLDDDEATASAIDADGWLHTGDRGLCDENGYFRILGRKSDMVIVGGFNVYPAEVEDMMREHPDIENVALIGVPDERLGEVTCAYVVPRGGEGDFSQDEILAWCRERMANFKVPRYVVPIKEFPLTGSNKVSKVDLREMAADQGIGARNVS